MVSGDLFATLPDPRPAQIALGEGACLLPGFASPSMQQVLAAIDAVLAQAPLRHMHTPGGHRMSVSMSSCGALGWTSDRLGYRYLALDPQSGLPWPLMPTILLQLAAQAAAQAGYAGFVPDSCLINCYLPGAGMSLHQDKNERDVAAPIVSVSLGLPAVFMFGGLQRSDPVQRYRLVHGDVAVWGAASRFYFHGVAPLKHGEHAMLGSRRINLTFRKVR